MSQSNRIGNSIRNVFFGMVKYSIMIIVPFVIRTILIYKLGNEYAGVTSLFTSILQVLSLTELGFSSAVVYSLYEPVAQNDNKKISALLRLFRKIYIICGCIILIAGICVCPFVKRLISGTYPNDINIYVIFLILLFNTAISYLLCGYKSVLFIAFQRDDLGSKCQIISNLIMYSVQIIVLFFLSSYYLYTIAMVAGTVINNCLLHYFSRKYYPDIIIDGEVEAAEKKQIYENVKALFGHQLDVVVITSADNIVISAFLGLNVLTAYNNYYYIISASLDVLIMVANAFVASIGNSIAVESPEKNYNDFLLFTYSLGFINVGVAVMMLALFQDFMEIWMGSNRLFGMTTVVLLVVSFYVRQFRRSVLTYKNASGVWGLDKYKPYFAAVFNIVVNIILVKNIGIDGVIISTILSMILIEIPWETIAIFRSYFKKNAFQYLKIQAFLIIKLVAVSALCFKISTLYKAVSIQAFVIKGIVMFLITASLLLIISYKDEEFKRLLLLMKRISGN